jgi:hypothetical protein
VDVFLEPEAALNVGTSMTIPTSSVPEILDEANSTGTLRFVTSSDAKKLIVRLKGQAQLTDDEVITLAVIAGEAALAKYFDPTQDERCDQAICDIFSILDHDAVLLAMRRKIRGLLSSDSSSIGHVS